MEHSKPALEDLYARLSIEDEENGGFIIEEAAILANKESYTLVGRFLTEKNINFNAMQNVLASLWRPKEGMEVHDLGDYRYSFVFYHTMDLQKVLEGGPWSFEQNTLVYDIILAESDPKIMKLNDIDIWVQVYDIPKGFISENILSGVGNFVGTFLKADPASLDGIWKPFIRIRVRMDITRPLKRRMKIKREGGEWSWINFKYERLGTFCFVCGTLGHMERDCNIVYANPGREIERAYGTWLRAPNRNSKINTGARWLRNGGGGGSVYSGGSSSVEGREDMEKDKAKFTEANGVRHENREADGVVIVSARNQGYGNKDKDGLNSKNVNEILSERETVIMDPKRRRVECGLEEKNDGPAHMQTDGPIINNTQDKADPKNLQLAGPVDQARLGL